MYEYSWTALDWACLILAGFTSPGWLLVDLDWLHLAQLG